MSESTPHKSTERESADLPDIWFVYDGECPICRLGADMYRLRQNVGKLYTVDARTDAAHPILKEIKLAKLNLDDGMVIKYQDRLHHGVNAAKLMAQLGSNEGWFNKINTKLYKSALLARLSYPLMRAARNFALWRKGAGKINNLSDQKKGVPIFKSIFGADWEKLPKVMKAHYENRAFSCDRTIVTSSMDIFIHPVLKLTAPLIRLTKTLVSRAGKNIDVHVTFKSASNSADYIFERFFTYEDGRCEMFNSRMEPVGGNEVVDWTKSGLGWHAAYALEEGKIIISHKGYRFRLFGFSFPLPLEFLLGRTNAVETPASEDEFDMLMEIKHPVFGLLYSYGGRFKIKRWAHETDILVLGGYGNFGKRICENLAMKGFKLAIAGRNYGKANLLADKLSESCAPVSFDMESELADQLAVIKPKVVINTCGPFQGSDYSAPQVCLDEGVHYIDLADGRDFVCGIAELDDTAKKKKVSIISGASTVPCLSSAILDRYKGKFSAIDFVKYGIAMGQRSERGYATTRGVMSYVGKPLAPFPSISEPAYGWQDMYQQNYPELGPRWMGNIDIPDLDLFPKAYGIKLIQFSAGAELSFIHFGIYTLSKIVRSGVPLPLARMSGALLAASNLFNFMGTADSGLHMIIEGKDKSGKDLKKSWFITAKDGDGPHIPTIPAIILAERLASGEKFKYGAMPCIGLVSLKEYLAELEPYNITIFEDPKL